MVLFVAYTYYQRIDAGITGRAEYGELRPKSALFALYDVEHFVKNGDTVPPLMTDDVRWQRMIFDAPEKTQIMYMDDRTQYYTTEIDTLEGLITFKIGRDSLQKSYDLNYEKLENGIKISRVLESDTLNINLKTYDLSNFYLTNRGFHLLNEVPWHRYDPIPKPNW